MWDQLHHHLSVTGHLSSPLLAVVGVVGLLATETVPGENGLIRAGAASAAVVAVGLLVYRLVRLIRAANDMVDAWQEVRAEVLTDPPLQKRLKQLDEGQLEILDQIRQMRGER